MDQLKGLKKVILKCKNHSSQNVSYVCISDKCKDKILCSWCIKDEQHKGHNINTYMLKEFIDDKQIDDFLLNIFGLESIDITDLTIRFESLSKQINDKLSEMQKIILNRLNEQNSAYNNIKALARDYQQNLISQLNQYKSYEEISQTINNFLELKGNINHQVKIDMKTFNKIENDLLTKCGQFQNLLSNQQKLLTNESKFQNSFQNKFQNCIQLHSDSQLQLRLDLQLFKNKLNNSNYKMTSKIFLNHLLNPKQNYRIIFKVEFDNINKFYQRNQQIDNNQISVNQQQNLIINDIPNEQQNEQNSNQNQNLFHQSSSNNCNGLFSKNQVLFGGNTQGLFGNKNEDQTGGIYNNNNNNRKKIGANKSDSLEIQTQQQNYGLFGNPSNSKNSLKDRNESRKRESLQQQQSNNQQQQIQIDESESIFQMPEVNYEEELPIISENEVSQIQLQENNNFLQNLFQFECLKLILIDSNQTIFKRFTFQNSSSQNQFGYGNQFYIKSSDEIEINLNNNNIEVIIPNQNQVKEQIIFQENIQSYQIGYILYYKIHDNLIQSIQSYVSSLKKDITITGPILTIKNIDQII